MHDIAAREIQKTGSKGHRPCGRDTYGIHPRFIRIRDTIDGSNLKRVHMDVDRVRERRCVDQGPFLDGTNLGNHIITLGIKWFAVDGKERIVEEALYILDAQHNLAMPCQFVVCNICQYPVFGQVALWNSPAKRNTRRNAWVIFGDDKRYWQDAQGAKMLYPDQKMDGAVGRHLVLHP